MFLQKSKSVMGARARALASSYISRQAQRGIGMVELSIVLVIVSVLAAGAFFGFQANSRRVEIRDNTGQITEIAAALKSTFGRQNAYGGTNPVSIALAVQSRVIPNSLRVSASEAANTYGGRIDIVPYSSSGCAGTVAQCASLSWPSVPQSHCMDLVINTQDVAREIQVAGQPVKQMDSALNIATLATSCEGGGANVALTYIVGR